MRPLVLIALAFGIAHADRSDGSPEPCSAGFAAFHAKNLPRAYVLLSKCDDATAKQQLVAIEARLGTGNYAFVELVVQPTHARTSGAFEEPLIGSRKFWLPFGTYRLTTQADGYTDRVTNLVVNDHAPRSITIALDPTEQQSQPPQSRKAPAKLKPPPTLRPALITSMATLGFAGSALVFALHTPSGGTADDGRARRHAAWTLAGIATAGAIASGYLWYRVATYKVDVVVSPGGAIAITGRW